MGLFPSKPKVEVFAPTTLVIGRPVTIDVVITADEPTKIDFVDVGLVGRQGWAVGAGKNRVTYSASFPDDIVRVHEAGVLAAGTTRLAGKFVLPPGMAPTHHVDPAWATLEVRVRISIPWWIDARPRFYLPVRLPPPAASLTRTPVMTSSARSGAAADKPRLELSLASARLIAGETVLGSVSAFHVDDRKPREVELSLVPVVRLHGRGRTRDRRGKSIDMTFELPAGRAGKNVPFEFPLPAAITPSFSTVSHDLSWMLYVSSGSFFSGKLETAIALEIVDASAAATTARLTAAPQLGDDRIASLFAAFADSYGWRAVADDDEALAANVVIERELGGLVMRIAHDYRGKDGTYLITQLAYPGLGLGVSVAPSSSLRHVFFRDLEIDVAEFDRGHQVSARSRDQTKPWLAAVVPSLMSVLPLLGTIVRWDDEDLVIERSVASIDSSDLVMIDRALVTLAGAFDRARSAVIPPPELVVDLEAWRLLARVFHGQLTVGDLSIDGHLEGVPVQLGLEWDLEGQPIGVRAHVGDPDAASALAREVTVALARPASEALACSAQQLIEPLLHWPRDIVDLRITDGVASASWTIADRTADADRVRELVSVLRALVAALDPGAGPYR
ncbi:MAG: hypothetical protein AB7O24_01660 [Kofleriaceae bacterium]